MSRRAKNDAAFSLFAFQDIITSVTGIMILVTLILALELIEQVESSATQSTERTVREIESTEATVAALENSVARNQARIDELRDRLQRGDSRLDDMAGFDPRAVEEDVSDATQINEQLEKDLKSLAKQVEETDQRRKKISKARKKKVDAEAIQRRIQEAERKKRELEKLKNSKRVIFNPSEGDEKVPWLMEISADKMVAAKVGVSAPPMNFANLAAVQDWLGQRNRNQEYFVLLVKPDGVQNYQIIRTLLTQRGFEMGSNLLEADQTAIDPETGAGAP